MSNTQGNEKAGFDSSIVVVQPIDKGMIDLLDKQDNLYHVNLQGLAASGCHLVLFTTGQGIALFKSGVTL